MRVGLSPDLASFRGDGFSTGMQEKVQVKAAAGESIMHFTCRFG